MIYTRNITPLGEKSLCTEEEKRWDFTCRMVNQFNAVNSGGSALNHGNTPPSIWSRIVENITNLPS